MGEEIMKFKKIMLVTLMLLAIIAIGAVSAADNLTDTPASDQLEISGDDAIISNDDSQIQENNGTLSEYGDYGDGELEEIDPSSINIPKVYVIGTSDDEGIRINLPWDFDGQMTFKLGDKILCDRNVYDGEAYINFDGEDYGTYDWQLNLTDSGYKPLTMNGSIELTYIKIDVPEKVILGSYYDSYLIATFSTSVSGQITAYIDGEKYDSKKIYIDDGDSYLRVYLNKLPLGDHSYEVAYSGNMDPVKVNGTLNVDYVFAIEGNGEDTVTYGENCNITLILPWDASGKITARVNGKSFEADVDSLDEDYDDDNYIKMEIGNLNLGDNTVTLTYSGNDKYPAKTINTTVKAAAVIQYEHNMLYTNPYLTLLLPKNAKGNLIVRIDDEDFANVTGKSGLYNVSLKSLNMGVYHLDAYYDGEDYGVDEVDGYFSIIPKITAPDVAGYYEGALISIEVPSDTVGNFSIYKRTPYDDDDRTLVNFTEIKNGKASLLLKSFDYAIEDDYDYNHFTLEFKSEKYTYETYYTPRMMYHPKDSDFEVSVEENILKRSEYLTCHATDNVSRHYNVYIDGNFVCEKWNGIEEEFDSDYDMEIPVENLSYGKHKIEFRYVDNNGFYNSINKTYYFNVTYLMIEIPQKIIDSGEVVARFDDGVYGNLTLYIDGKEYGFEKLDSSDYGSENFFINSLAYATHEFEVVYSGDGEHAGITEKANVDFTYPIELYGYNTDEGMYATYGQNMDITVVLPLDVTGNVTITVNGKKYTAKAYDYTDITIGNFAYGNDEIAVTYEGDSKYPARTVKYPVSTYAVIFFENNVVSLTLPSDAEGNLTVKIGDGEYLTAALSNGKASIDLNALENINYIDAWYTGEDYSTYNLYENYKYNITAPNYVWIEEGALITANLPSDYTGDIIVYQCHGSYYDEYIEKTEINRTTLVNGYGTVRITTFDGVATDYEYYDDNCVNEYRIEYVTGGLVKYSMRYHPKVMPDNPHTELKLNLYKEALKDDYLYVYTNLDINDYDSIHNGFINVYIDGEYYRRYYNNDFEVNCENLTYGTHTVKVDYSGTDYYSKSTASESFNVTWTRVYVSDEVIVGEYENLDFIGSGLSVSSNHDAKGYVLVYIDDEVVCADFANYYGIELDFSNYTAGTHTYKVVYSGDSKYGPITKTGTFKAKYSGMLITDSYIYDGDDENIRVIVPKDATGMIELTVNEDKYTETLINGTARFIIKGLGEGKYNVTAKYLGDEKYDPYVVDTDEITVYGQSQYDYSISIDNDGELHYGDSVTLSLELPETAEGKLIVYVNDELYNATGLVDGKASITISDMAYGTYSIYARYDGYDEFYVDTFYHTAHVSPKIGEYKWIYSIDEEIIIPIEFESDANGELEIYDDEKLLGSQKVTNGKINLDLTNIAHFNSNYLTIKYDDGKYNYTDSIYFKVYPKLTYPENITVKEACEISFLFPDDFNGQVEVCIIANEKETFRATTNVVGGKASITANNLTGGTNRMTYTYRDENRTFSQFDYGVGYTYYRINVEKLDGEVEVTNSATATKVQFDADATGAVIVKIDDDYFYFELENGEAEFDAVGSEIAITYTGDKTYKSFKNMPANSTGTAVDLKNPELSVSAQDVDVGSDVTINVKANSGLTADVKINVDGKDYTVNVKNGKGSLKVSDLAAKTYTVTATFAGNDEFKKSKNTTTFAVKKLAPEIAVSADESIVEQSDLAIEVTVAGATGNVKINGQTVTLANGKASTTISNLPLGENTITVAYSGDDKYLNATTSVKVNVYAKADPELKVTVADINAGNAAVVSIEIDDAATGNVIVTFNNTDTPASISNGKASMELKGLGEGTYTVTVKYDGNKYLTSGEANATFRVTKFAATVSVSDIKFTYGGSGSATITLTGASGVEATVEGHPEAVISIEGDKITVSNLNAGTYSLKVTAVPLPDYATASATASVTVGKMATKISSTKLTTTYNVAGKVTFTLKDEDGRVLSGENVTVIFNGNTYNKVTNAKGQVSFDVSSRLAPKTYYVYIKFEGDESFKASSANTKVVVLKATPKITAKAKTFKKSVKTKKYTVTLKTNQNKVMKNTKLTLKVNGKTYSAKTNAKGQATFKITKLTKKGKFTAVVKFAGNKYYNAKTVKPKITVK